MEHLLDSELRERLARRFGDAVHAWFDTLPPVLVELAERWQLELLGVVQRGTVSAVIRCRTADGRAAVLKLSPARSRILDEAAALRRWSTPHVPAVLAVDERAGALLVEAIEPGTPLDESGAQPAVGELAELIRALHVEPAAGDTPVAERAAYFFEAGLKDYARHPGLVAVVPHALYERGRRTAARLAESSHDSVFMHGDLTAVNVLDGGPVRGLVAIDPAPCVGDPAFDAVDLVFWRATDVETVVERTEQLAPAIGADPERMLAWCVAEAPLVALELSAWSPGETRRIQALLELAAIPTRWSPAAST